MQKEDKILSEFLKAVGPWSQHIVIGGGFAPIIYKLYLAGSNAKSFPVGTRDIDTLVPRRISSVSQKSLGKFLIEAQFTQVFRGVGLPATESYVKEVNGEEVEIEFLTDTAVRKDKNKNVRIAGIVAQPLSYLTLSLQKTVPFETYSKERGRVVSPEAWMFHKGLTFKKRKESSKLYKDLYGIWYVASQLGDFSEKANRAFRLLAKENPKWFKALQRRLRSWQKNATPLDWTYLEAQDPLGKIKNNHFFHVISELTASSLH